MVLYHIFFLHPNIFRLSGSIGVAFILEEIFVIIASFLLTWYPVFYYLLTWFGNAHIISSICFPMGTHTMYVSTKDSFHYLAFFFPQIFINNSLIMLWYYSMQILQFCIQFLLNIFCSLFFSDKYLSNISF